MLDVLESARKVSEYTNKPIFAYSNGDRILYITEEEKKWIHESLVNDGYWVCSIFENGYRVEA